MDDSSELNNNDGGVVDKASLIEELSTYLTDSRQRLTLGQEENGEDPLLIFPPDFDTIANAMSREDLASSDKDWSFYLFANKFKMDHDGSLEQGRYQSLFREGYAIEEITSRNNEDYKVAMGLAEIALLDRQLKAALRRAKEIQEDGETEGEREDLTFITNAGQQHRTPSGGVSLRKPPTTNDEMRLALLLQNKESEPENHSPSRRDGFLGFLSENEVSRLQEIDRRLEAIGSAISGGPVIQPADVITDDAAPVLQRLQRVRDEYSKALDMAMSRVRGDTGAFVPYLQPVALNEDDLVHLARHEDTTQPSQQSEDEASSSLLERVR